MSNNNFRQSIRYLPMISKLRHTSTILLAMTPFALVPMVVQAAPASFDFTLPKDAKSTSAGVYNADGQLVRVLWTRKPMSKGTFTADWDGNDELGKEAPAGRYSYKVVSNNSTYKNLGVIGNTGKPANSFAHVPINFEAVTVDSEDRIFTTHDWDEPHHDCNMWDPETGQLISTGGHFTTAGKGVAVDDEYAYVSAYEQPWDRKNAKFLVVKVKIKKEQNADGWEHVNFTKAGDVLYVVNGGAEYPEGTVEEDRRIMYIPVLSLAIKGDLLYATDSIHGSVHVYDKTTGEQKFELQAKLAQTVAVGDDGKIWVGHEHTKVSVYDPQGNYIGTPVTDLKDVNAIVVRFGKLYVADQGAGQVKIYTINGNNVSFLRTFGDKARPGDRASHRFYFLHGLAVDSKGNMITVQNEYFFNGGRLAKFTPEGKPLWEQMGLEFTSQGAYGPTDPDLFISLTHHAYRLDRKTGEWKYLGNTYNNDPWSGGWMGVPHVTRIGQNDFYYLPTGNGMAIYRIMPPADKYRGPTLILSSLIGQQPANSEPWKTDVVKLWTWHDEQGDNTPQQEEINFFDKPGEQDYWYYGPMTVDDQNNIWFCSYDWGGGEASNAIYCIPYLGADKLGNPIYDWAKAKVDVPMAQFPGNPGTREPFWIQPRIAGHTTDGMTFCYGKSEKYPGVDFNGGLHMGGNVLLGFKEGELRWCTKMPSMAVGLDVIPGGQGGVMVGGDPFGGGVHHYTKDGLLIGGMAPDHDIMGGPPHNPSGLIDMFAGVSVARDPRDGILDVFVEDDYNLRIAWYRVDDKDIQTVTGIFNKG